MKFVIHVKWKTRNVGLFGGDAAMRCEKRKFHFTFLCDVCTFYFKGTCWLIGKERR